MKLVGYCRVSTENQREEGTIEIQHNALRAYCDRHHYDLVAVFSDNGCSGSKDLENRPGLAEMFDYLESHSEVDGVVIYKLDRLARDLYIQEHLYRKLSDMRKQLISISEPDVCSNDPMRKAFRQFLGIVAELEKSFIAMRLSAGRVNKARKGGYAGGRPAYGYKAEGSGELTKDEQSAHIAAEIFHMRKQGCSLREIAKTLNDRHLPSPRGGVWNSSTIGYMLNNPLYSGIVRYGGIRAVNAELGLLQNRSSMPRYRDNTLVPDKLKTSLQEHA